jgi:hypothetical protein
MPLQRRLQPVLLFELTLGEVAGAVEDAEQSVSHADRSGDAFWKMASRCKIADALHQWGRRAEAKARFREAEQCTRRTNPTTHCCIH